MTVRATAQVKPPTTDRPASEPVIPISWEYLQFHALLDELRALRTATTQIASMLAVIVLVMSIGMLLAVGMAWFLS